MVACPKADGATREEAVALARQGKLDEAISDLQQLLEVKPLDPAVAYDLAVIYTWAGKSREATDAFEKAGEGEPPEYVLGPMIRAYHDQKRFPVAERWVRDAIGRYPENPDWPKLLDLILADEKSTSEAARQNAAREEAVALAHQGKLDAAIAKLQQLLEVKPLDPRVVYDLALVYTWAGKGREATDTFEKAGESEPRSMCSDR
jgi:Flp pilus assembly protein TadD